MHLQGVALWGGPGFERLVRLAHPQVKLVDFSPDETYIITWSPLAIALPPNAASNPNIPFTPEDEGNHICVWDRASGKLMRTFPMVTAVVPETVILPAVPDELPSAGRPDPPKMTPEEKRAKARKMLEEDAKKKTFTWPIFKWSGDERYLARVTQGAQISIYEAPSMGLVDKKSVKIEGVMDFEWRPLGEAEREAAEAPEGSALHKKALEHENILAYWVVELQNQPARCNLMSVPSRKIERSRNLVNVSDVRPVPP